MITTLIILSAASFTILSACMIVAGRKRAPLFDGIMPRDIPDGSGEGLW